MVVVSGTWVKNVVSFPINGDLITTVKMAAKAVLICRPNSHPFQERTLSLDQPVKIGRSVARARAVPNNAIFDCKVLSRNHALLWYENGKFYLQDTKSSNGTFVNNQRLSKGAEESPPREVCSGDIVQFGVDVMENARKVTHGCIVATVKLYLPDGKEAKASPSTSVVSSVGLVPLEDLYQLNIYLQEALQREHMLETKLAALQKIVDTTREASEQAWKALIDEDRLLSRVETLENQLLSSSKNFGDDKIREEIKKLLDDKELYQVKAKENLQKLLQEKLEAVLKLQALELSISNSESESLHLKQICAQGQQDLQELAQKYTAQVQKVEELTTKMQESEEQNKETAEKLEQEKLELQHGLEAQTEHTQELQLRLDAVQSDDNLNHQRMADIHSQLQLMKSNEENEGDVKEGLDNNLGDSEHQAEVIMQCLEPTLSENEKEGMDELRYKLKNCEEQLQGSKSLIVQLQMKLDAVRSEEEEIAGGSLIMQERLNEIGIAMDVASTEIDTNKCADGEVPVPSDKMSRLQAEHSNLKELLDGTRGRKRKLAEEKEVYEQDLNAANMSVKKLTEEVNTFKQQLLAAQSQVHSKSQEMMEMENRMRLMQASLAEHVNGIEILQDKIREETQRANKLEVTTEVLRDQLVDANHTIKRIRNEAEITKNRLKAANVSQVEAMKAAETEKEQELEVLKSRVAELEDDIATLRNNCEIMNVNYEHQLDAANNQGEELMRRLDEAGVPREVNNDEIEDELVEIKTNYVELVQTCEQLKLEFEAYRVAHPNVATKIFEMMDRLPVVAIVIVLFALSWAIYLW